MHHAEVVEEKKSAGRRLRRSWLLVYLFTVSAHFVTSPGEEVTKEDLKNAIPAKSNYRISRPSMTCDEALASTEVGYVSYVPRCVCACGVNRSLQGVSLLSHRDATDDSDASDSSSDSVEARKAKIEDMSTSDHCCSYHFCSAGHCGMVVFPGFVAYGARCGVHRWNPVH